MSISNDFIETLASATLLADANDLPALAKLHEQLTAIPQLAAQTPGLSADVVSQLEGTARTASSLVEHIILRDVDDVAAALDSVCEGVAQLQRLLGDPTGLESGRAPVTPGPSAGSAVATARAEETDVAVSTEPLPKAEDLPLVQEFIAEARGHLETAEADLLKVEEEPENHELINSVFRAFHTIKGVAGFLNLKQIGKLAHASESLLDLARKGELTVAGDVLDLLLESLDATKGLLGDIEMAVKQGTDIPAQPKLRMILDRLRLAASGAPAAGGQPVTGPQAQVDPVVAAASPAVAATLAVSTPPSLTTPAIAATHHATNTPAAESPAAGTAAAESTVKVATGRLDALINMVGELVIAQAMVSQDVFTVLNGDQRMARNLSHLGKITRELQDLTMAMRMVPIQGVFQKMSRLVRDLTRKAGKEIDLRIVGGETELDRNLVEAIGDPLVHMVRNAADHGIEMPDDRRRAGKPAAGHVELKAYHQAGNIVVEISDDGKGLNKKRILQKAREAGLVREGQELSEQDIFRLIFQPGLSTAEKVTDVSGRGVGMDVVRRNVEALRGRIDISSVEGRGSTFTIRLPLTLAVIDGLVVKVGAERYIVPITSIEQSLRPKAEQISTVQNRGEMCLLRGALLPLCRLYELLRVKPTTTDPCQALLVLVQDGQRRCALLVDELLGQQQVVIKSLGEARAKVPGVSGGAILGDGTISLILDVPGLMDLVAAS